MSTTQTYQRRRTPRRKVSAPSVIRIELKDGRGHPRNITADLVDWSEKGLSVAVFAPLEPGTVIRVRGKLGEESRGMSRQASVSWCREDASGRFRVGLEFIDSESPGDSKAPIRTTLAN